MVKINSSEEGLCFLAVKLIKPFWMEGLKSQLWPAVSQKNLRCAMNFPFFVERKSGYEIYHQARRGNSWFVFRKKYDLVNNLWSFVDSFLYSKSKKVLK